MSLNVIVRVGAARPLIARASAAGSASAGAPPNAATGCTTATDDTVLAPPGTRARFQAVGASAVSVDAATLPLMPPPMR